MGKVVITGSSGLVGTGIVAWALQNTAHELILVDATASPSSTVQTLLEKGVYNARVTSVEADLTVPESWPSFIEGADALIHLPAIYNQKHTQFAVQNTNSALSWNALLSAANARVGRVVMMSSINAIGGLFNKECPRYHYFPLDESHPSLAEDAYSVSKIALESQAGAMARANSSFMRIASIRPHFVAEAKPSLKRDTETRKDLWGWTSIESLARACFLALEIKERGVASGTHEAFFIVGEEHCCDGHEAGELARAFYPDTELRFANGAMEKAQGFYSCEKAERVLGWKHTGGAMPVGGW